MNRLRLGFVLLSSSRNPIPSTRIAALNILPFLRAANCDAEVVFEPQYATETPSVGDLAERLIARRFDVIVFQKVHGPSVEDTVAKVSLAGIKTIYLVCDLVNLAMARLTDATIVVTDFLKSLYPAELHHKIHVVHDGIENPAIHKEEWTSHHGSKRRPLNAVLVTSDALDRLPVIGAPPNWLKVTIVGRYPSQGHPIARLRGAYWTLAGQKTWRERGACASFLTCRRIERQAWNPVAVYDALRRADIGIIPIETSAIDPRSIVAPHWKVKSENRLTMKMCIGLPVVATPIPAYEEVVQDGENGFLARSRDDWIKCLSILRNPETRRLIGDRARQSVIEKYSMHEQARRFVGVLQSIMDHEKTARTAVFR